MASRNHPKPARTPASQGRSGRKHGHVDETQAAGEPVLALDPRRVQTDASEAIAATAAACDLDVVATEIKPAGRDFRIVVLADRRPGRGGITLDDCAALSLAVAARLDAIDGFAERYELEVSSPGMDRPLRHLADCARFVGVDVRVTYLDDGGEAHTVTALLAGTDGAAQSIVLRQPAAKGKPRPSDLVLAWKHVQRARLAPTLTQWQAIGARLAAETPEIALDQTGGLPDCTEPQESEIG